MTKQQKDSALLYSIFTPTHKPTYLAELYECLKNQTNPNWEWVIVENMISALDEPRDFSDNWHNLPSILLEKYVPDAVADRRIRVIRAPVLTAQKGVGALKKFACSHCTGDYLIEIDHDDLVREDMLELTEKAIAEHNAPDFIYSDFAEFLPDGTPHYYLPDTGWESYDEVWQGRHYLAMRAFEPSPATMARIWYAPNHVRIIKRSAYEAVGGHDEAYFVCDDHELICRMYASGYTFHHIPACLYFYRMLPNSGNTYLEHNDKIQALNVDVGNAYLPHMVMAWAKAHDGVMLDMGGSHNRPDGYLSVDMWGSPDIKIDITQSPLPYSDNTVSVIRCNDFLEHIKPDHVVKVMNEFYRVLKPGGYLLTNTPAFPSKAAVQDPTHVSFWCNNSFWYYTDTHQRQYNHDFNGLFHAIRNDEYYLDEWHKANDIKYVVCVMVKLQGNRVAGSDLKLVQLQ